MDDRYLSAPLKVEVSLTDSCNQNCRHCSNKFKINKEKVFYKTSFVSKFLECNPFLVILSGGEPLLHPNLIDIIAQIKKAGSNIRILTNGVLITKVFIQKLIEAGWQKEDVMQVSLDASNDKVYRLQRGTDDFNRVIQSISLLSLYGIRVDVHAVPTKINQNQIVEIYELSNKNGAYAFSGGPLAPFNQQTQKLMCSAGDLETIHEQLIHQSKSSNTLYLGGVEGESCISYSILKKKQKEYINNSVVDKIRIYRCAAGRSSCYINEHGNVYPCVYLQYDKCLVGNIEICSLDMLTPNEAETLYWKLHN